MVRAGNSSVRTLMVKQQLLVLDIPYLCRRMVQLLQLEHHSIVNLVIIRVM